MTTYRDLSGNNLGGVTLDEMVGDKFGAEGIATSAPVVTQGGVAHDAPATAAPVTVGGIAYGSGVLPTAVQAGDSARMAVTLQGAVVISGGTVNNVGGWEGDASAQQLASDNGNYYKLAVVNYNWNGATTVAQRGDTNGSYVVAKPVTSGGLSIARLIAATSGVIKASAGQLYGGTLTNTNAAIRYLQLYNKATAGTLSTDTPVLTIPLPPNVSVMVDFSSLGAAFATGISWQFTTDDIAIPTTAGATTDIHGFVTFK